MDYNAPSFSTDPNAGYVGKTASTIGSKVPPKAVEFTQREIVHAIRAAGLTPSNNDLTQLLQAVSRGIWLGTFGGTADALTATMPYSAAGTDPVLVPAFVAGMRVRGIAATGNATTTPKVTLLGVGAAGSSVVLPIVGPDGVMAVPIGAWKAGQFLTFDIDASGNARFSGGVGTNVRQLLRGSVAVWIRPDGNDGNDGSANTAGSAFQTLQGAFNAVKSLYDANGFSIAMRLGVPGTYAGALFSNYTGAITVLGDEANAQGYVLQEPAGQISVIQCTFPTLTLAGLTLDSTVSGAGSTVNVQRGGDVFVRNCRYRRTSNNGSILHNYVDTGGRLTWLNAIAVLGNAAGAVTVGSVINVGPQGAFSSQSANPAAVSVTNLDLATGFVVCGAGYAGVSAATFAGTATGPKFLVQANGVINSGAQGTGFLPGSVTPSAPYASGGQYI